MKKDKPALALLTQEEQLTQARIADQLSCSIARLAGCGENIYTATCRALHEHPDIIRAVMEFERQDRSVGRNL